MVITLEIIMSLCASSDSILRGVNLASKLSFFGPIFHPESLLTTIRKFYDRVDN